MKNRVRVFVEFLVLSVNINKIYKVFKRQVNNEKVQIFNVDAMLYH